MSPQDRIRPRIIPALEKIAGDPSNISIYELYITPQEARELLEEIYRERQ